MKFLILALFICSAYADFESDVKQSQDQLAQLREQVDQTMASCMHTAQGKHEGQNITANAKKASDMCNRMWVECPLKQYELDMGKTACIANYQKAETALCAELKPFGDLTGAMPETLWKKICSPDEKDFKEGKHWTSENSKMPTTRMAYKCLEEMEDALDNLKEGNQCTPKLF